MLLLIPVHQLSSAVNMILKSKLVYCKAITGSHRLTGFCVQVQHPSLLMSVFNINIYTGAPKIHCKDLKLKIKDL